uniref:Uncharacterized protein n=1 Tax=Cryptomonas curvata TaxID=233186 RepID=A0A7S0M8J9_9CRYP
MWSFVFTGDLLTGASAFPPNKSLQGPYAGACKPIQPAGGVSSLRSKLTSVAPLDAAGPAPTTSALSNSPPHQHSKVCNLREEVEQAETTFLVCCEPETLLLQPPPPQDYLARQDAAAGGGGGRRCNVPANVPEGSAAPILEWAGMGVVVISVVAALWLVLLRSCGIK